jgi:hypothetical protein
MCSISSLSSYKLAELTMEPGSLDTKRDLANWLQALQLLRLI